MSVDIEQVKFWMCNASAADRMSARAHSRLLVVEGTDISHGKLLILH